MLTCFFQLPAPARLAIDLGYEVEVMPKGTTEWSPWQRYLGLAPEFQVRVSPGQQWAGDWAAEAQYHKFKELYESLKKTS